MSLKKKIDPSSKSLYILIDYIQFYFYDFSLQMSMIILMRC